MVYDKTSPKEKISGIYSAATKCGWQVFQTAQSPTAANIRKIKAMINPFGFIIDQLSSTRAIQREPFGETPVVLISRDYHRTRQIFDCSRQDVIQPGGDRRPSPPMAMLMTDRPLQSFS